MIIFDMRRPSRSDYADAMQVTVCRRSFTERVWAAWWILLAGWRS